MIETACASNACFVLLLWVMLLARPLHVSAGWSFEVSASDGQSMRSVTFGERAERAQFEKVFAEQMSVDRPRRPAQESRDMRESLLKAAIEASASRPLAKNSEEASETVPWPLPKLVGEGRYASLGDGIQRVNLLGPSFVERVESRREEVRDRFNKMFKSVPLLRAFREQEDELRRLYPSLYANSAPSYSTCLLYTSPSPRDRG
eukprot:6482038-Amphidinium_carterae.2